MFRANFQRSGIYNTTGIRQLKGLKWKIARSNISFILDFGLVLADRTLCLGNWDGNVYALDFETGREVWKYKVGENFPFNTNFFNCSTVADGTVYLSSFAIGQNIEILKAIDLSTGREKWQFETKIQPVNASNNYFSAVSVAVANGIVYFGSGDGNLYSIDAVSGDRLGYFRTTKNMPLSHPAIKDNLICVYSNDGYLYAIDTETQQQRWKFEIGGIASGYSIIPAIANNKVYVLVNNTVLYALDLETGVELWDFTLGKANFSQPAISDRFVCLTNNNKELYALDPENGEMIWKLPVKNTLSYFPSSGPVIANNIIYLSGMGCLQAIDLETKNKLWEFKPESTDFLQPKFWLDLGSETWQAFTGDYPSLDFFSTPIVADGTIYFGSAYGYLYALEAV
ncbi:MAG: PQQ-binding-like beta-propeller repeat protein [Prochloraceae cyanobacterium]|nr:PQQ-binding-like beta-propeller repeat protein [Prochloraceae cyanobacterium]